MIMRKLFNTLFVIIAAMVTFAGCAKEEVNAPANETKTVQFIAESIETKTQFGSPVNNSYPTFWEEGDKVKVFLNIAQVAGTEKSVDVTPSVDHLSAKFEAEITDPAISSYTFYSISPAGAYNGKSEKDGRITVVIPEEQTSQERLDEKAQVLYAVSETTTSMPSSVNMNFHHMTAYGKFSLTNLSDKVSSISQVKIVAPEGICLSGKWNYMIADGSIIAHGDNTSNFVTIKTTNTENIWFACAPVDASGKDVKFIVTTDKGDLEKTVRFPKAFESGKIATFAVNMSSIEPPVQEETTQYYQKVTSDLNDWSGKYLLVYETGKKVLSSISTTSTKYGVGTEVTITDGKIQATADVMSYQIEITKSSSGDEYLMNFGGKYLTWTSDNSLNVATSVSDNTTWIIAVSNGNATITNKKDKTRVIKWNSSSPRFACYTSGQTAVQLYKLIEDGNEGGETPDVPTAPILTVTPAIIEIGCAGGNEELSYTVTNPSDGVSVAVSTTAEWISIDDSTEGKVIISVAENTLTEVREATISLSYEGAETMTVVVTQKAWVDTSKIEELTVAEFLNAPVDETVYYKLKGTITSVANTSYGNFDLTDDTGTVHIYGLYSADGTTNKYWASSGAKLGDDIIISVTRGVYNNVAQGTNARFVELVSPGTRAFFTLSTTAVDFSSAGGEQVVTVVAYNTDATVTASSDNPQFSVAVDGYNVTISSDANELEDNVEGNISVKVGNLEATVVKVALAAKPAAGIVEGGQDDFHTISSTSTSYTSSTTTSGWSAKNCAVLKGGTSDSNPTFKMIGDESNRAFCMNGKTSAVGTITSPDLTTGCGTLKFSYGLPFSDTKIKFRVDIKQNGSVVKTFTVAPTSVTKLTKYEHEEVINVSGIFQIVFTNLSPSNSTSNKDRTAIWDVEWTGCN